MSLKHDSIETFSKKYQELYTKRKIILSFPQFVELLQGKTRKYIRNAAGYLLDTFKHYGKDHVNNYKLYESDRFKVFDLKTDRNGAIVGGESVHNEIYNYVDNFARNGYVDKLILLHGPNGSSKTSTIEKISHAMEKYSQTDDGAVYRFNWIFPAEKELGMLEFSQAKKIGFDAQKEKSIYQNTFAFLPEHKIQAKISSEFKENPVFLLPIQYRETVLRNSIAKQEKIKPEDVLLPAHILKNGLSKKNQQILECLLAAYNGDLNKVLRHVQVERFFYSSQYRVGISSVEPQMSVDAMDRQITVENYFANLPSILQTQSFYQYSGELVEANRGILEFSDFLKRPVESFKYLLNTIESGVLNLSSGGTNLDILYFGTTNDKHLDAFKTIPDFSSFKGRISLLTVPYLLLPNEEEKIYQDDVKNIERTTKVLPLAMKILCKWAVLTRLKQADPKLYPLKYTGLLNKLDPFYKLKLFQNERIQPKFTREEEKDLREIRQDLWKESKGMIVYEGRFGASPREIKEILYRAAQNKKFQEVSPMAIFFELEQLMKNTSLYEYLQFEPRGEYHDVKYFIKVLMDEYIETFERQVMESMAIADESEYTSYLHRYVQHVVSYIKKEDLWDEATSNQIPPSEALMTHVEKILEIKESILNHRNSILGRIAAFKLENPEKELNTNDIFSEYLNLIKLHFFNEKKKLIENIYKTMIEINEKGCNTSASEDAKSIANKTYNNMIENFGYSKESAFRCLQFVMNEKKK